MISYKKISNNINDLISTCTAQTMQHNYYWTLQPVLIVRCTRLCIINVSLSIQTIIIIRFNYTNDCFGYIRIIAIVYFEWNYPTRLTLNPIRFLFKERLSQLTTSHRSCTILQLSTHYFLTFI